MLRRLRWKFVGITMLIVFVMLLVIFGTIFRFTRSNLEADSVRMMEEIAEDPFQLGRPGEGEDRVHLPYFTLQIGPLGEILATGGGYYDLSDREFLADVMIAALEAQVQTGILEEHGLRFYRVSTPVSHCLVFADISSEQATLDALVRNCVLIGTAGLLAFFVLSLLLARWAVKPVEQAWIQQRQFVADASHELKTPLTVIMTNAELLRDPDQPETDRAQFAASILTMSRQMRGLVEGLLDLARVDNGSVKLHFETLNLTELVADGVLPFEPVFFEQGLTLQCRLERELRLWGSRDHLRQVLDILLDNAQKYSTPQGLVSVCLSRQGNHALLSVSNPGEDLSREELRDIFKRFYRVDQARTLSGSYGLGLPIAEGIVRLHKGKIWAESRDGIITFFVQLPV